MLFEMHFMFFLVSNNKALLKLFLLWTLRLAVRKFINTLLLVGKDVDEFLGVVTVCPPFFSPFGVTACSLERWFTCSPCISNYTQLCCFLIYPLSISWALWAVFNTEETKSDE